MNTFLLILILTTDFVFGYFLYLMYKRKEDHGEELETLYEETNELKELKNQFEQEMQDCRNYLKDGQKRVEHLASEIEREITGSKEAMTKELSEVLQALTGKISAPLLEIEKKKESIGLLLRKLENEKQQFRAMLNKAEQLSKFFDMKVPYDQVLKDIEYKKYQDARKMFAQGCSKDQICKELGLNAAEINIVQQLSLSNTAY